MKNSKIKKSTKIAILAAVGLISSQSLANTIGNDFQKLNPIGSGINYTVVEPSETIETGTLNTGILVDYSTNVLPVIEANGSEQSITSVEDSIMSSHIYASYGIMKDLELGLNLPMILTQSAGSDENYQGEILSAGVSYIGGFAKYKLWSNSKYGIAIGTHIGTDLMTSNPYIGDASPIYFTTYVAADAKFELIELAVNAGYKYRSNGDAIIDEEFGVAPIEPIPGEFIYSAAANYKFSKNKSATLELFGSIGMGAGLDDSDRSSSSAELLGSYRQNLSNRYGLTAGASTEVLHGVGSADLRFFAGFSMKTDVPSLSGFGSSSSSSSGSNVSSSKTDDDVYSVPSYESAPENTYKEDLKSEEPDPSGEYNIEESELPTFDDPDDYSIE
jgi:hypothetical protein